MKRTEIAMHTLLRPEPEWLIYQTLKSFLLGPFFLLALMPAVFRFRTLRYRFDDDGVTMAWGVLFRREVSLTYARIQDIHLAADLVERWLGLARVKLQTAAGSATAEISIEGLPDAEAVRDFLYTRVRRASGTAASDDGGEVDPLVEAVEALREAACELRALRLDRLGDQAESSCEND